jgi:hypothetical protein
LRSCVVESVLRQVDGAAGNPTRAPVVLRAMMLRDALIVPARSQAAVVEFVITELLMLATTFGLSTFQAGLPISIRSGVVCRSGPLDGAAPSSPTRSPVATPVDVDCPPS